MRFSFIVRAFNAEATIGRTLRSALSQDADPSDYEVVVVDDGSTDATGSIVAGFADPRIRHIAQMHKGLQAASAVGAAEARGERILFLDADDESLPHTARTVALALDGNSDYVFGSYYEEYSDARILVEPQTEFQAPAGALAWDRARFLAEGGFSGETIFPEYDLLLRTSKRWRGTRIHDPLFIYHRSSASLTGDRARVEDSIRMLMQKYPERAETIRGIRSYLLS